MKRLFLAGCLFVALLLVFTVPDVKAGEGVLIDPGFEMGSEEWSEWNSDEEAASGEISTEQFHSGSHSAKRWLTNPTELTYSVFIQPLNIDVNEGDVISFSGWMMSPPEDPLKLGAEALLVIEFWSGGEKVDFPESTRLGRRSQWKKYTVSGVVPEGADAVKVCAFLFGFEGASGTVYFDDLKVEIK